MKHLYSPKSKIPTRPILTLALIMVFVMVSFNAFSQVLAPVKQNTSNSKQLPTGDLNAASLSKNFPQSNYDDLESMSRGEADLNFNCDDGFGYILTNVITSNGYVTGLYTFDLSSNTLSLVKDPLIPNTTTSQFVNAIGYNVVDNYLYGLLQRSNKVVKIDSNGDLELFTVTGLTNYTSNNYASGDIDENGILYIYGSSKFVAIDLNPTSPDYLIANTVLNYSVTINDMAFSPVDNNLYMLTSTGSRSLLKFDTTTNTISTIGQVSGLESETHNSFGTAYMDALGNMYVANNNSGNTYKIGTPHLGGLTATYYSNLSGVSPGDGARCPSQPTKPMANPDDICFTSDMSDVIINVAANDSEGTYAIDTASVQLIDPVTLVASSSVTVAGQGTFTIGANGEVTFEALSTFTGTSIEYTILDVIGYSSNIGLITINLNNVEAPTGEATQEFCENENATIADLEVTGNNITWYSSSNNNTALDSNVALNDGTTYYASQTNSEGCESTERLAVTVNFSDDMTLVSPEETSCVAVGGTLYTIEATFTGTAPFTASGDGQSGTFTDNNDGTTTWISSEIESSVETYNVTISDHCGSLVLTGSSPAECLNTPFDCDDGFAYIIVNERDSQNNFVSGLYSYDLATHTQTLIKAPLIEDTSVSQFVNGIGYNTLDNNIYGLQQFTNNIVKIDASANVEFLPITGSFTIGDYSSGDIDDNGMLVLHGENKFVSIDLNPSSPNYLTATTLLNYTVNINDITHNPVDGNFYMVTSTTNRKLLRFNTNTNTVDDLGLVTGLSSETNNSFGTAYMDILGNMFIANNSSGNIYRIATPHTGNLVATLFSSLIDVQPGDGARCPSQLVTPMADDDSICFIEENTEIEINVLENDSEGTYSIDPNSVLLIDPITLTPTNTVTISGQGTFTVGSNGIVVFEVLPSFTGASVEYTIADIIGSISSPATITVSLNETPMPTGDDVQEFCASSEPTIANLNATGENIQWYTDETSTSPIDSTEMLVDGETYYATQTTSEGCESIERLAVTVNFTADITLVTTEALECSDDGSTYTIVATFTGTAPFTANGNGQPGTWVTNSNDTFTWTSDAISGDQPYNVEIQDVNSCNTITLSGEAAICCEFEVTCPTFEETTLECYGDLPSQTAYTTAEFEALGNGDGTIGNNPCGVIEITAQNSSDQGTCEQTITRTYTITSYEDTNANGIHDENETTILNSEECTQLIVVSDTTVPTFSVPANITIECDVDVTDLTLTGDVTDEADNCTTDLEATFTDSIVDGICPGSTIITRNWSLTDDCNNTTTFAQTITIIDTTAPTFSVPADISLECDVDVTNLALTGDVTDEADNCASNLEATYSDSVADGTCPSISIITRTWSLSDDCDNTTSFIQTITIQDTTAPVFNETLPADLNAECDAVPSAETLTATDSCGTADVVFVEEITNGSCDSDYIIERKWTATDTCGNEAIHIQIITVQDNSAPTLSGSLDTTLNVTCDSIPVVPSLVFEDSCSSNIAVSFNETTNQADGVDTYNIIRTWTASDDCGNEGIFTQTITVELSNVIEATDANRCILDTEFDLFDLLSGDFNMNGTWSVTSGDANINGSLFDPSTAEVGIYTFMYSISDDLCSSEIEVNVTLDDDCVVLACGEDDVVISKTVTANGDAYNEFFAITGVEDCGFVIELQIFNRWGAEIYKSNNYLNNWNGDAHSSSVGSSGKVPTGTYYYIINLKNSGLAPIAGPIYVATN